MGVLIKKLNKIQVSGNFWPAVYVCKKFDLELMVFKLNSNSNLTSGLSNLT